MGATRAPRKHTDGRRRGRQERFDDLLGALALLHSDRHWRLVHIGGGPLLRSWGHGAQAGPRDRVQWRGPQSHAAVLEAYRAADLFVLPCRVSADGDRDGLPNVLLEAQSQKLACVSTACRRSGTDRGRSHRAARGAARACRAGRGAVAADRGSALRLRLAKRLRADDRRVLAGCRADCCAPVRGLVRCGMKVAFYAPLKPPDHPVPSGDRQLARRCCSRCVREATRHPWHRASAASTARRRRPPGADRRRGRAAGAAPPRPLPARGRAAGPLVHVSPLPQGSGFPRSAREPRAGHPVCRRRGVRRACAAQRSVGAWYAASVAGIEAASAALVLNPADVAACASCGAGGDHRGAAAVPRSRRLHRSATPPVREARPRTARVRLITVAMMRPGNKLASTSFWRLRCRGSRPSTGNCWSWATASRVRGRGGVCRHRPAAPALRRHPDRRPRCRAAPAKRPLSLAGDRRGDRHGVRRGQACGLPVVGGHTRGVASVVAADRTGILVPAGDVDAFAAATTRLATDAELRDRMGREAVAYVRARHDLPPLPRASMRCCVA